MIRSLFATVARFSGVLPCAGERPRPPSLDGRRWRSLFADWLQLLAHALEPAEVKQARSDELLETLRRLEGTAQAPSTTAKPPRPPALPCSICEICLGHATDAPLSPRERVRFLAWMGRGLVQTEGGPRCLFHFHAMHERPIEAARGVPST